MVERAITIERAIEKKAINRLTKLLKKAKRLRAIFFVIIKL